ncbi:MAG: adenylosuccinate lyase [Candidatus Kariarchaeaceae archaeon]
MSMWIERYKTEINELFTAENVLRKQLEVERVLAEANSECGFIPKEAGEEIAEKSTMEFVKLERVREIEKEIHHEPMNIVMGIAEQCPNYGGYVHYGATSNDIMDTMWGLIIKEATSTILKEGKNLQQILINFIEKYKEVTIIGRTHGQHAIPTTLGFKFANFLAELDLALINLKDAPTGYGKISGAIGNYASFGTMEVEKIVLEKLRLQKPMITTQVIPRIMHATFMFALAGICSVIERLAKEIRHLQRTEIGELQEPFKPSQVGSSTMPQKKNPHKTERICGLARVVRANVQASLETIPLEHERDISNSSLERIIIPESFILTHYILKQIITIVKDLGVNKERIKENLYLTEGRQCAERVMLALTDKVGRQRGHKILKSLAHEKDFEQAILSHEEVGQIFTREELEKLLDPLTYIGLATEKAEEVVDQIRKKIK